MNKALLEHIRVEDYAGDFANPYRLLALTNYIVGTVLRFADQLSSTQNLVQSQDLSRALDLALEPSDDRLISKQITISEYQQTYTTYVDNANYINFLARFISVIGIVSLVLPLESIAGVAGNIKWAFLALGGLFTMLISYQSYLGGILAQYLTDTGNTSEADDLIYRVRTYVLKVFFTENLASYVNFFYLKDIAI
eukprot:403358220